MLAIQNQVMEIVPWCSQGALYIPTSSAGTRRRCHQAFGAAFARSAAGTTVTDHLKFITDAAGLEPPTHLQTLLDVLQAKGEQLASPEKRDGLHPLVIPLTKDNAGTITALLRWPTAPDGMAMPVVQAHSYGLSLLAKSVDNYIHRLLVEEDAESGEMCFNAAAALGSVHYKKGDYVNSKIPSVDVYLIKKVGLFPDVFERLALNHLKKGDQVSAMVTGEYYVKKDHFPGFGRPFVFNAELMTKVGRLPEAKDAARMALKSPWWTLGCEYKKVAEMAGWGDEKVEYMKERMTEEGRKEELNKGKDPIQVALDQAAFLLDLGAVDGNWDQIRERLSLFYQEAGLEIISKFILV